MNTSEPNWVAKIAALEAKLGREANLNELLVLARGHYMTDEEIEAQKLSYARAEAAFGSDAAEAAYRAAVMKGDKTEIKRLDDEAILRVANITKRQS